MHRNFHVINFISLLFFLTLTTQAFAYVPEPNPPTSKITVGVFRMPAWKLGPIGDFKWGWLSIDSVPERKPLLGYYDEGNPEVMDWEIKWALEHGINLFIFNWSRCTDTGNIFVQTCKRDLGYPITVDKLNLGHDLHDGFFHSRYQNKMNFALMVGGHYPYSYIFKDMEDLQNNLMPFLINEYFQKPNYYKFNGSPVLFIWDPTAFESITGSAKNARVAVSLMKQKVKEAGFPDLIVLGHTDDFTAHQLNRTNKLKSYGMDYIFSYMNLPYYNSSGQTQQFPDEYQAVAGQVASYKWYRDNGAPLPYVMTASSRWNSYYMNFNDNPAIRFLISHVQFGSLLASYKTTMSTIDSSLLGSKLIILDAWNEFTEGHYLMPTVGDQFNYLKTIRLRLTFADNTPDYRLPGTLGLGPYDNWYRNYQQKYVKPYTEVKSAHYQFSGNDDDFVDITGLDFSIHKTNKLTFGAWIYPDLDEGKNSAIILERANSFRLLIEKDGSGHCTVNTEGGQGGYAVGTYPSWPTGSIKSQTWQHLICVYNGQYLTAYLNGKRLKTSTNAISGNLENQDDRNRLAHKAHVKTNSYKGGIFSTLITNTALSDSAILSLYHSQLSLIPETPILIPSDLNNDGLVNLADYNLLVASFGNPYTIYDYNKVIKNIY